MTNPKKLQLQKDSFEWIGEWVRNSKSHEQYMHLPVEYEQYFVKSKGEYIIYRGLTFSKDYLLKHFSKFHDNLDFAKKSISSTINLKLNKLTSWSTNPEVAEFFGNGGDDTVGLVLRLTTNSRYVLVDVNKTIGKDHGDSYEDEVIMKPGNYKVEVYGIYPEEYINLSFGLDRYTEI